MTDQTAIDESAPASKGGLLDGKVILVTGASRGIGAAAASLFAEEGAEVVLAARDETALQRVVDGIRAAGGIADAVVFDLADADSTWAGVARAAKLYGRLDGAFNNAGAPQQPGPLDVTSEEDIDAQATVNFRGQWTAMKAQPEAMRAIGGGAIVNTSSLGGLRQSTDLPAYSAIKRALNSLTETAAVTWAREGIRVNALAPGGTLTDMWNQWEAAQPGTIAAVGAAVPLGRMVEPREVAEAAAWLLSDRAAMVTGVVLPVDGGGSVAG
ncbi:SDR family NAD(P)-dependent oxidoreductase [Streptomyces shenzhenensis]|uniref:Short-chain dehydrogenase n=1 Tax=Streptomyces shenzhenensis TaxID=943815 RepID=A0A3M0I2S2_9ACTN|nr:SDR family oxidoreductase [Streptomyces shenzhenensis]RMB80379.1 short-chain dehydrogenase [Streptomyces shenzhenensis]